MDYFEGLIKTLMENKGYWVRQSYKINLSKEEKRNIGKPSMPRPEIDLLAFKPGCNHVIALEVKSFLDSSGVYLEHLQESFEEPKGRYKLFTCRNYREIVFNRLKEDLISDGLITKTTKITLGIAAGKIYKSKSDEVREYFSSLDWFFLSPEEIKSHLVDLSKSRYENEPSIITAKVLLR